MAASWSSFKPTSGERSTAAMLTAIPDRAQATLEIAGQAIRGIVRTYSDRPAGTLLTLVGSSGYLEVADVNGSAAARLHAAAYGTFGFVTWCRYEN